MNDLKDVDSPSVNCSKSSLSHQALVWSVVALTWHARRLVSIQKAGTFKALLAGDWTSHLFVKGYHNFNQQEEQEKEDATRSTCQ